MAPQAQSPAMKTEPVDSDERYDPPSVGNTPKIAQHTSSFSLPVRTSRPLPYAPPQQHYNPIPSASAASHGPVGSTSWLQAELAKATAAATAPTPAPAPKPVAYDPASTAAPEQYDPTRPAMTFGTFSLAHRPAPASNQEVSQATPSSSFLSAPTQRATTKRVESETGFGDTIEAPTVCWDQYRSLPQQHMLACGHMTTTTHPRQCGSSCKLSAKAITEAYGAPIGCYACSRPKRNAASRVTTSYRGPFLPHAQRKVNKGKAPARKDSLFIPEGEGRASEKRMALPSERFGSSARVQKAPRKPKKFDRDEDLRQLNKLIEADPALMKLVASEAGRHMRTRSKIHAGYAYQDELEAAALLSRLPKEVQRLKTDGTDALKFGLRPKQNFLGGSVEDGPDHRRLEVGKSDLKPWSYGKSTTRKKHSAMSSMPAGDYERMLAEEDGVTVSEGLDNEQQLPRAREDYGDGDQDDEFDGNNARGIQADGTYFEEERHCATCELETGEGLEQCADCEKWLHPSCHGETNFERCSACTSRRGAYENFADGIFVKPTQARKSTKLRTEADIRAFNARRRAERKEAIERLQHEVALSKSGGEVLDKMDVDVTNQSAEAAKGAGSKTKAEWKQDMQQRSRELLSTVNIQEQKAGGGSGSGLVHNDSAAKAGSEDVEMGL
ncbi:uncharacterized protein LTR77_008179 [Saxophila tyrrhenica]|uniref:Zinc finger PHD-type domain-containing protein n=1 Tax=Saxophila tyrrhenica TaxID=1690608 RepID=A0AAV9P218_9PEZI|nr:hypothetical protein LTR77_008179 [Saxophila tyrrhenica]